MIELRRRRAREWDQTLTEVRAREGFEHFLAPTPYTEFANQMLQALERSHGTRLEREKARHEVLDVLEWLWNAIAEPVLTSLEYTAPLPADGPWPRVWWCPTGALSVLPIHAAGHHPRHRTTEGVAGEGATVPDRVVSSYTPILTALVRAREPGQPGPARQLTIGMPTTPGLPPLPAVTGELAVLASHFPPGKTNAQLVEPEATCKAVLNAITTHPCPLRADQINLVVHRKPEQHPYDSRHSRGENPECPSTPMAPSPGLHLRSCSIWRSRPALGSAARGPEAA